MHVRNLISVIRVVVTIIVYSIMQDVPKQTNSTDCGVFISQVIP